MHNPSALMLCILMYIPFEICIFFWCEVCFKCAIFISYLLIMIILGLQMSMDSIIFVGYANGANHSNMASSAWVILTTIDELILSGGMTLGPVANNVVEYNVVIGLLSKSISLGIECLVFQLDSQLFVR
jgi:hypothetical protein